MALAGCVRYVDQTDASGPATRDGISSLDGKRDVPIRLDRAVGSDLAPVFDQALERDCESPTDQAAERDHESPADQAAEKDVDTSCSKYSSWTCTPGSKLDAGSSQECLATCGTKTITCTADKACFCDYSISCGTFTNQGCNVCGNAFNAGCCP